MEHLGASVSKDVIRHCISFPSFFYLFLLAAYTCMSLSGAVPVDIQQALKWTPHVICAE